MRKLLELLARVVLLSLLSLLVVSVASGATYVLEDLGRFYPSSVSNNGQMSGQWCSDVLCMPALMTKGEVEVLEERYGGAWTLNDRGDAAGDVCDEAGCPALFWGADGSREELSVGQSWWTRARPARLNNQQTIVGRLSIPGQSGSCPTRWQTPTSEPTCPVEFAGNGFAAALNESGLEAGFWQSDENGEDGAYRGKPGGYEDIPFGVPVAINHRGIILYQQEGLLSPDGQRVPLPARQGCGNLQGVDLNDAGLVLLQADCQVGQDFVSRALLWSAKTGYVDLTAAVNDPHWVFPSAQELNNLGEVVLWGERDGELRGVRLTPRLVAVVRSRLGR